MIKAFWFVFIQSIIAGWKHTMELVRRRRWINEVAKKMPPSVKWSNTSDSQIAKIRYLTQQHFDPEKQREFNKNVKAQLDEDAEREIEMQVYANFMNQSKNDSNRVVRTLTTPEKDDTISGEKLIPDTSQKK